MFAKANRGDNMDNLQKPPGLRHADFLSRRRGRRFAKIIRYAARKSDMKY
jgi:hypothetical protein